MTLILVAGALANKPLNGGEAWVRLSWVLGLARLGFDVFFLEQIAADQCVDEAGARCPCEESVNCRYFRRAMADCGLTDRSALICTPSMQTTSNSAAALADLASSAAALINISGHLQLVSLCSRIRRKVYIDIDPGFTQFWHAQGTGCPGLAGHDDYFTIGENIGTAGCSIPTSGIRWQSVRQPVLLDQWPVMAAVDRNRLTTVSSWRGPYGPIVDGGRTLGLKVHEFRKFIALPRIAPQQFEIALNIHPADRADRDSLQENGWRLVDPAVHAATPDAFRRYVQESGGEFSVAQGVYVDTNSGWFSDRTTRYLASGKPVLVQDTGLARHFPVGKGLLTFRTLEEAASQAQRLAEAYDEHAAAARTIAETHFASDVVLGRLVDQLGITP